MIRPSWTEPPPFSKSAPPARPSPADVTSIHPLLPALEDEPTKAEIIKALFELTKNVEVVKKQVMRLEKRDDSALL